MRARKLRTRRSELKDIEDAMKSADGTEAHADVHSPRRSGSGTSEEGINRSEPSLGVSLRRNIRRAIAISRPDQEAISLDEGVDKFEWRRGYKFLHVRDVVDSPGYHPRDCRQARTIRIPVHMIERSTNSWHQPAARAGTWARTYQRRDRKRMDIPVSKVRKILKIAQEPISLETPIGEEEIRISATSSKTRPWFGRPMR